MSLKEKAMIARLYQPVWTGKKIDRDAGDAVVEAKHARKGAGIYNKYLVPYESLRPVFKAQATARKKFHELSLPWDEGERIVSAESFFDFRSAMMKEKSNVETKVENFVKQYPALVSMASSRLGDMYNADDFPEAEVIRGRFGFRMTIMPIPDKDDFRVSIGEEYEKEIRADIEATVESRFREAQRELWGRILDTVEHFAATMKQHDKVFRNSTVNKLQELADFAPKMSIGDDPRLLEVCGRIKKLAASGPDVLRANQVVRAQHAEEALATVKEIEEAMRGAF